MKKIHIRLIETSIWLLILSIGLYSSISFIKHNSENRQHYQVRFKDVDGLIVGSPVRLMGIQIGYVSKIEPIFDVVYLTFVINKKDVHLPDNAVVDVQFTGMAGSKSLEIVQSEPNGKTRFKIEEPLRVDHVIHVQDAIADAVLAGSRTCLGLLGDKSTSETQGQIIKLKHLTKDNQKAVVGFNSNLTKASDGIVRNAEMSKKRIENTNNSVRISELDKEGIMSSLMLISNISNSSATLISKKSLSKFRKQLYSENIKIKAFASKLPSSCDLKYSLDELTNKMDRFNNLDTSEQKIDDIKKKIEDIKNTSYNLQKSL